jgi:phosphatidylinositol alpha-1,6-mannosyltransferase
VRVLIVTNDLPPRVGGIQYYVDQLARGLVAAGDEVTMLGSTSPGAAEFDADAPYRVVRRDTETLLPTPAVRRHAERLVRECDAEVVIFGAAFPLGLMGPHLRRRTGVPYVGFTHGLEVTAARTWLGRRFLRRIGSRAAALTFVSQWCDDELRGAFGDGPEYRRLAPAVDPDEFHAGVSGAAIRERHGLTGRPVVVSVSRLVERKGQDTLVRLLPALRERVGDAALLIVGDGPHRAELEASARAGGVGDHVVFAGQVADDELPAYDAAGDVFAFPTRERRRGLEVEAFGIVVIQAAAVGVPVVAGRTGGVPDAVGGPETGVLVDPHDDAAVLDAIAALLQDADRRDRMGRAAAARIVAEFTWSTRTDELRELLAAVSRTGGSASRPADR